MLTMAGDPSQILDVEEVNKEGKRETDSGLYGGLHSDIQRPKKPKKPNFNCHKCGKPGHFAKDCRVNIPRRNERSSTEPRKEFKRKALNETASSEEEYNSHKPPQSEEEPESETDF